MFNESRESNIILQGVLLTGIKDISFSSSVSESSTKLLNNKGIKRKIYGPPKTTCSFSKAYNGKDFIQSLTGASNLSGQFIYKDNAIDFSDAAISNYTLNLDENGFAEISVTMQIFGNMNPTTNLQLSTASEDFPILDQTPTITHFDLGSKNSAIKSLNYQASLNPKSSNNIGSIISSNVDFTSPTKHSISADIEMLEQEVEDVTGFAENDQLTKNIDIIFGTPGNKTSIDRILEIQSTVRDIESSGFDLSDLDFSVGTCAYNAFQFNESSISNQNLNAKAGEVVQLKNQYNAYTNIKKITGSIPAPNQFPTCDSHLQKLENNLNVALGRPLDVFFTNQVDFENRDVGETNFNLFSGQTSTVVALAESDFENRPIGEHVQNILAFTDFYKHLVDFENDTVGAQNLILPRDPLLFDETETFELSTKGATGLIHLTGTLDMQITFENFSKGATGLIEPTIVNDFFHEVDLEDLSIGSTGLIDLKINNTFFNETDLEGGTVGAVSTNLNQLIIDNFFNENDFEGETVGQISTNLINL